MHKFSCYLTDNLLHFHYEDQLVNFVRERLLCIVIIDWNIRAHCVHKMQFFLILKQMVYILTIL